MEYPRSHPSQYLFDGLLSTNQNNSTTTSPQIQRTVFLPGLPLLWDQYLLLTAAHLYESGRPGPPWPPPTKFLRARPITANTDPSTAFQKNHTDTRPSRALQPTVHHPRKPLHALTRNIHQLHHHPHLCRRPKYWWYNQQIFHDVQQDPIPQDILTYMTAESTIHQWANNCHDNIPNHRKAVKTRAKLHIPDIQQHYIRNIGPHPSTSDKNLLRPP